MIRDDPFYGDYYISEDKYKKLIQYKVNANDVLVSMVGTYGKVLVIPEIFEKGIINPRLIKLSFDIEKIYPQFFKYMFTLKEFQNCLAHNSHGGTMSILNLRILKQLKLIVPSISMQMVFLEFLYQVDKSKLAVQKSIDQLEILKKSLMQEYFG